MTRRRKRTKAIFQIMNFVILTSILTFAMNNVVLGMSAYRGAWIGGDVFCQLFAYFSNSLISFVILGATLATFERKYAVIDPDKHLQVFTPINTKLLVAGFWMLSVLLCAGPLYGWGEYSNFKGVMKILISVTLDRNDSESFTDSPQNTTLGSILCQPNNGTHYNRMQEIADRTMSTVLQEWPGTFRRSLISNCENGQIILLLRAQKTAVADFIFRDISVMRFDDVIMEKNNESVGHETGLLLKSTVDRNDFQLYRDTYISFQSIGVCSLDFSPTNAYVLSSTIYVLCTTVIAPLLLMILNVLVIYKHIKCPYYSLNGDVPYLRCVNVGGIASAMCCIPYYIINFLNMHGVVINRIVNILCTAMFYNAPLCISLPFLIKYISKLLKRRPTRPIVEATELQSIVDSTVE
ncbi:uncharacterized protein LOC133182498 [Saccostrea echinata]|uniref:uncharacterized protein LOC133182498 n=1 Tax=Saccostrea echinata TaxID=191078 RepID=UPI002A82C4E5|nr:uncharacterized protein LOC133182498 [Saccostrea echinata]